MHSKIIENINDENPIGNDSKYEDEYLLIEQEIDYDTSVTAQRRTDWNIVVKSSVKFLINTSKDLKIATWWLYGMWNTVSWSGLKESLGIYINLLEKFNVEIFPKSSKIKTNIFLWLENKLNVEFLAKKDSIQYESEFFKLFTNLNAIIKIILDKEDEYFRKIIRHLESVKVDAGVKEELVLSKTEIKKEEAKKEVSNNNNALNNLNISKIENDSQANDVLREFKKYSSMLNTYYRNQDFCDIRAIRINRLLSWIDVDGLPYNDKNITMVNPPLITEVDEIVEFYNNNDFKEAFKLIEEILEVSPFWFEGHLRAYDILIKTNNSSIANELKNSIISFISSNDGIMNLYFKDESPFASKKFKEWINENSNTEENSENTENSKNTKIEEIVSKANELAQNNKLQEAMKLFEKSYNKASCMEEKFNWRLKHAELAIEFDNKDIALALLEDLELQIDKYNLENWNPKLSSEVFSLMLNSFNNIELDNEKIEVLYKKLCRIDINQALKIKI